MELGMIYSPVVEPSVEDWTVAGDGPAVGTCCAPGPDDVAALVTGWFGLVVIALAVVVVVVGGRCGVPDILRVAEHVTSTWAKIKWKIELKFIGK